jgi:transposase
MTRGRHTKLTAEVQSKIVEAILAGNYFETACQYAGVSKITGYEWLARGEGKDPNGRKNAPHFAEFANAVREAEARAEVGAVAIIRQALPENPKLALDYLSRRHPERWGAKDTLTVLKKLAKEVEGMGDEELLDTLGQSRPGGEPPGAAGGQEEGAADGGDDP